MSIKAFDLPNGESITVTLAVTTTSSNVAIPSGSTLRIFNASDETIFIAAGPTDAVVATSGGLPIPSKAVEVFTVDYNDKYLAGIAVTTGGNLYLTGGDGV